MFLKSYRRGIPALGSILKVDRSIFLNQIEQALAISNSNTNQRMVSGHNSNFNIDQVIKSAIGEWIERKSLFRDHFPEEQFISAVNMLTGEIIRVPKEKILFKETTFNDSCGVASHIDSKNVIKGSYYEFYERQSLVHSWITKSEGVKIDLTKVNHSTIKYLIDSHYLFIDELYLIDISLYKSLKVVMGLGIGEHYKSIGLGANFDGEKAVISALEEMFQSYANNWSKSYINKKVIDESPKRITENLYQENFMNLTSMDLKDLYSYLINGTRTIELFDYIQEKKEFSIEAIKEISDSLDLPPYCAFFPPFYKGLKTRNVKIFSPKGYPHMHPPLFTEEESYITFNRSNCTFPNAFKELPFP